MKNYIFAFLCLLLLSYSIPASSQTKWFKYEGNPVLDVGPKGTWDEANVFAARVIRVQDTLKMWYTGSSLSNNDRIGYAWSTDGGITWTKHPLNPVMTPTQSWELGWTFSPFVIFTGSEYKMWYTGADGQGRIGYATSPNGIKWTKFAGNPVVDRGPLPWDTLRVEWPSVLGPDRAGGFKMWYAGYNLKINYSIQIGYATATDETTWTKADRVNPLLIPTPGSWDAGRIKSPRVISDGQVYKMWYSGGTQQFLNHRLGYATSPDGINWAKHSANPVLQPDQNSWDAAAVAMPEVLFDGTTYHMWYVGYDGAKFQIGYAVSPKDADVTVSHSNSYLKPRTDPVRMAVKLTDPAGFSFAASIKAPAGRAASGDQTGKVVTREVVLVDLLDDGMHGDGLAGDGLFANTWIPPDEKVYFVDLKMKLRKKNVQKFEMEKAGVFTTIGPVKVERVEIAGDRKHTPGDSVLIKVVLRNHGTSAPAQSISTLVSPADSFITAIDSLSRTYGDIPAGGSASTSGYYKLHISPNAPVDEEVRINVSISSLGATLWRDTFTLSVAAPWWRTNLAYGLYLLFIVGSIGGMIRYVETRKLKGRIKRLERERAIERERARISQDMHDEIGATLTEIAILSELAKKKPEEAGKQVQQISERTAEIIDNIGEIVWALNPKNDSLDNVIAHIRRHAVEYLKLTPIKCRFAVPDALPAYPLSAEIRRNLFLVVKEAIHNIVKHSQASKVTISVMIEKSKLELLIDDNGRGFSIDERLGSGNGLHNMKKRIEEIGGTFHLDSTPNQGTKVRIVLNLQAHK